MSIRRTLIVAVVVLALAGGAVYWFAFSRPEKLVHRDVVSARVEEVPARTDQLRAEMWSGAQPLVSKNLSIRSVHDDERVAFLFEWEDPTLSIGTSGAWQFKDGKWLQNRALGKWDSFAGKRHPEWLGLYWNMDSPDFARQGCTATCHEGTGKHHTTPKVGEHVDTWHLLAKHGWGPVFVEDQGWLIGSGSTTQTGDVRFADEAMDPRQPVSGSFTFAGYGEDGVLSNPADEVMQADKTSAKEYCSSCHDAPEAVGGDAGAIPYSRNSGAQGSTPGFVETQPESFVDAMVLTSSEIDSGEAAEVSKLSEQEVRSAWQRYEEMNATVPELVLSTPDRSASDLAVAASWTDGRWRLEVVRDLVTNEPDDVQFDDLGEEYGFALSLWDKSDLAGDLRMFPLLLSFEDR